MTIQPAGAAAPNPAAPNLFGESGADFTMFLRLLTTQMQNQDPLDPMDTSQYTQQLVQYSQVEQSLQQTGVLKDILARLSTQDFAQAAGLIGRTIEFDAPTAVLGADGASWNWSLPRAAASANGEILNASGKVVSKVPLPVSSSGTFTWDGTLADGSRAAPGAYTFRMDARDASGGSLTAAVHGTGRVTEVLQEQTGLVLGLGGLRIPAADVLRIAG